MPEEIGFDDFTRRFGLRAKNLMWLLGAGCSASAGIPTASDMIWQFKQHLYTSQMKVNPVVVDNLSDPGVRSRLQAHIDLSPDPPTPGSPDEYAVLFEMAYPAESDRRAFLDAKMKAAKPSVGHIGLAMLMQAGLTNLVWTTNFDTMMEDACAKVYEATSALTLVTLDSPNIAGQAISENRWPVEVKLHGDFRSRRLKNTEDELRSQDAVLRRILAESAGRFGLVVIGYSGRDDSIIDALEDGLRNGTPFPSGLFWLARGGSDGVLPRVNDLLIAARNKGVDAFIVSIENFDEALRDLIRNTRGVNLGLIEDFGQERRRWSAAPQPSGKRGWPVLRLNALPIEDFPSVCRLIECHIGGYRETREAVRESGGSALVARVRAGVLAFGSDSDLRAAFEHHGISKFGVHNIDKRRLRFESAEQGLLKDALSRALANKLVLVEIHHRSANLLAPFDAEDPKWTTLRELTGSIQGAVENEPGLTWKEGIRIGLEWADNRLWLAFEPRIVFSGMTVENRGAAASLARERTFNRYNRMLNSLIDFWGDQLSSPGESLETFGGIKDGIDAAFRLSTTTAYSWLIHP